GAGLGVVAHPAGVVVLATGATVVAAVDAEEYMSLVEHDDLQVARNKGIIAHVTLQCESRYPSLNLSDQISAAADQCVKCGLCLPHWPTYARSRDEGESPRGRIALMQALAEGQLPAGGRLTWHLDRCLGCRACERVCPSQVGYGQLLESTRALVSE